MRQRMRVWIILLGFLVCSLMVEEARADFGS
jgi:hypothetical protein